MDEKIKQASAGVDEREQFELSSAMRGLDISMFTPPSEKEYRNPDTQSEWNGWQARAQLAAPAGVPDDRPGYVRAMKEVAHHFRLANGKPGKVSLWALHQIRDFAAPPPAPASDVVPVLRAVTESLRHFMGVFGQGRIQDGKALDAADAMLNGDQA